MKFLILAFLILGWTLVHSSPVTKKVEKRTAIESIKANNLSKAVNSKEISTKFENIKPLFPNILNPALKTDNRKNKTKTAKKDDLNPTENSDSEDLTREKKSCRTFKTEPQPNKICLELDCGRTQDVVVCEEECQPAQCHPVQVIPVPQPVPIPIPSPQPPTYIIPPPCNQPQPQPYPPPPSPPYQPPIVTPPCNQPQPQPNPPSPAPGPPSPSPQPNPPQPQPAPFPPPPQPQPAPYPPSPVPHPSPPQPGPNPQPPCVIQPPCNQPHPQPPCQPPPSSPLQPVIVTPPCNKPPQVIYVPPNRPQYTCETYPWYYQTPSQPSTPTTICFETSNSGEVPQFKITSVQSPSNGVLSYPGQSLISTYQPGQAYISTPSSYPTSQTSSSIITYAPGQQYASSISQNQQAPSLSLIPSGTQQYYSNAIQNQGNQVSMVQYGNKPTVGTISSSLSATPISYAVTGPYAQNTLATAHTTYQKPASTYSTQGNCLGSQGCFSQLANKFPSLSLSGIKEQLSGLLGSPCSCKQCSQGSSVSQLLNSFSGSASTQGQRMVRRPETAADEKETVVNSNSNSQTVNDSADQSKISSSSANSQTNPQ